MPSEIINDTKGKSWNLKLCSNYIPTNNYTNILRLKREKEKKKKNLIKTKYLIKKLKKKKTKSTQKITNS